MRRFIFANPGKFLAYLSFHSFGSKILYPWSSTDEKVSHLVGFFSFLRIVFLFIILSFIIFSLLSIRLMYVCHNIYFIYHYIILFFSICKNSPFYHMLYIYIHLKCTACSENHVRFLFSFKLFNFHL